MNVPFVSRFNRKPRQGLQFLQAQKLLGDSIIDVARFLSAEDRLDKTVSKGNSKRFDQIH